MYEDRYELIPSRHGKWTLKLKYVLAQDAGKFECQISTAPKLNQTFTLKVVGRRMFINLIIEITNSTHLYNMNIR